MRDRNWELRWRQLLIITIAYGKYVLLIFLQTRESLVDQIQPWKWTSPCSLGEKTTKVVSYHSSGSSVDGAERHEKVLCMQCPIALQRHCYPLFRRPYVQELRLYQIHGVHTWHSGTAGYGIYAPDCKPQPKFCGSSNRSPYAKRRQILEICEVTK